MSLTLENTQRILNQFEILWPKVRGFPADVFHLSLGSHDGALEVYFKSPKTKGKKEFVNLIMKGMPTKAWAMFQSVEQLERILTGQEEPNWMMDDEIKIPPELEHKYE